MAAKRKPSSSRRKTPPSPEEWCFAKSRVPDKELVPCLLWEYLRESQTVRKLASEWQDLFKRHGSDEEQAALWQRMQELEININHPLRLWDFMVTVIVQTFGFRDLIDCPWQGLSDKIKSSLCESCRLNSPAFVGMDWDASIFNNLVGQKRTASGRTCIDAKVRLAKPFDGMEGILLVVDWANFDDAAIKESLAELVNGLERPEHLKPKFRKEPGQQRRTEWRGKLQSLGMARIHAFQHPKILKSQLPAAYEHFTHGLDDKGPTALQKKLAAGSKRFENAFHQVLTFDRRPPRCIASGRLAKK